MRKIKKQKVAVFLERRIHSLKKQKNRLTNSYRGTKSEILPVFDEAVNDLTKALSHLRRKCRK